MRRSMRSLALLAYVAAGALASCGGDRPPPPKVADVPMRDTAALPTSSADPAPPVTGPAPSAKPAPSASASASAAPATGAVTDAECEKIIHTFAELVAKEQGAALIEGFQGLPIFGAMRSQCVKDTTRAQYDCAVAAKSTQKWQECMK